MSIKKYFIYPNGGHSLMLSFNLKLLGLEYSFLDDFKPGLGLKENINSIKEWGGV